VYRVGEEDGVCWGSDIKTLRHCLMKDFSEVEDVKHNTLGCAIGYMMVKDEDDSCQNMQARMK